jgi:hypothetical protein
MKLRRLMVAVLLLLAVLPASAATRLGVATIVDGKSALIRGTERYLLAEGAFVEAGDIIEAEDAPGVVQIEMLEGGIVQLAAGARVLFNAPEGGVEPSIYLLRGWLKTINTGVSTVYPSIVYTPAMRILTHPGSAVIQALADKTLLFAEAGETETSDPASTLGRRLGAGQFYHSESGRSTRPPREFLESVPKTLRDSLPSRLSRMHSRNTALVRVTDFVYADVAAWLQSEPALRTLFVARWAVKAGEEDFRAALLQNLVLHPEWKPQLNPPGSRVADASRRSNTR